MPGHRKVSPKWTSSSIDLEQASLSRFKLPSDMRVVRVTALIHAILTTLMDCLQDASITTKPHVPTGALIGLKKLGHVIVHFRRQWIFWAGLLLCVYSLIFNGSQVLRDMNFSYQVRTYRPCQHNS